ncbi:MAG: bifunctional precorrin-2 dehydrogenase/sirohydrochlorin ferrochelatase [Lachnospiraceae bacterium]|nr:bifunctional precorrin-2 dehydrogenase/sirohydrochlorin ferrochelatase [Lachnospiraceae bacterium]
MHFPLFIDISKKNILIVGGGKVADRRVHTLLSFTEHITVVSPAFTDGLVSLAQSGQILLLKRYFEPEDLTGQDIVLAATDDIDLNKKISTLCREQGIPVNISNDQTLCDFQFPSIVTDGEIVIGINASGGNHRRVAETRQKLDELWNQIITAPPTP